MLLLLPDIHPPPFNHLIIEIGLLQLNSAMHVKRNQRNAPHFTSAARIRAMLLTPLRIR